MNGFFVNPNIATLGFTVSPFTPTYILELGNEGNCLVGWAMPTDRRCDGGHGPPYGNEKLALLPFRG